MTGIDRVELAYLQHLTGLDIPFFTLVRTGPGYVLLDRRGAAALLDLITGSDAWGAPELWSILLARRAGRARRAAEADLRRLAIGRALPQRLPALMRRHLPAGIAYLNVGHANLTPRVISAIRSIADARIAVMIHDTIPIDLPDTQRPGATPKFAAFLDRARTHADLLIFNSEATRQAVRSATAGSLPPGVVAHLGVTVPKPAPPASVQSPPSPYFVVLGTIEPRKGHDLLLDAWDAMAADLPPEALPHLLICGSRGWENKTVFDRLDAGPHGGAIRELPGLDDGAVANLLKGSRGLLMPSRAEGFGLPAVEAAALGVPVVLSDLPVFHELLGDIPVYVDKADHYHWRARIEALLTSPAKAPAFTAPAWQDHFNKVLRFT